MSGLRVGDITHFYNKIGVAVIILTDWIHLGDKLHILGHSTDFSQEVTSMEIEHQPINEAGPGQEIALKVQRRVRAGDKVFKLSGEQE